ncbi:MAG: hypothetical protein HYZ57_15940 [Acidobacteria bacterium]|nr:hypothetical protein [Acidobacteriota bacterium]
MPTIQEIKAREVVDTPLLLFECALSNGQVERWSTHQVSFDGNLYAARVQRHDFFEIQALSDGGIDGPARLSLALANADSHFSQIERNTGWRGARLLVRFIFYDLKAGAATSPDSVVFRGIANPPDEITESAMRLTFSNRLSLQRVLLPETRIQRRCPWNFPSTLAQRTEARDGADKGKYSAFIRCGYSPDVLDGLGNLNGAAPFTTCDFTRAACQQRGMFDTDASGNPTRRFGGIEFLPATILVKSFGEKTAHLSQMQANEAKYNDFVPLVYGTAWYEPPVIFARNDGNLTHFEVLLGIGELNGILRVVVNDAEIPPGDAGGSTATGWYNVVSLGNRTGGFNLDFGPEGTDDPHGSMAVLSVVVPNRINGGRSLPRIQVLLQGMQLSTFDASGVFVSDAFNNNPAWVLLDILRRSGWDFDELDLESFAAAAGYCDEQIETRDLNGNPKWIPRYQCNLVISKRRSAAELVRAIRNGSALYLTYGSDGKLQLRAEDSIAGQQPARPEYSNSSELLNGGWPAYEFGDGSSAFTDILVRENGEPAIRFWTRSTADSPNRFSLEFQDEFNEYQQDSLSVVDHEDALAVGYEVSGALNAAGIPNFNQAGRIIRLNLDRSIRGNLYVEFESGLRALGLKPGDLITLTYLKEGFTRQLFRVIKVAPGLNYRLSRITGQMHDDLWYADASGEITLAGGRRRPAFETGIPRPLAGSELDQYGEPQFGIAETLGESADGSGFTRLAVSFAQPRLPGGTTLGVPLVNPTADTDLTGGTLNGGTTYYYAVSANDAADAESGLSFLIRARTPAGPNTCTATLRDLSFPPGAASFNVYRGPNPEQLLRIASGQTIAATFTDAGAASELIPPPDRNFDHANFYWRVEILPETPATDFSPSTIGNSSLQLLVDEDVGRIARIQRGKGAGQERVIASHTATVLTLEPPWDVTPDATSVFVIAESAWQPGASGRVSPVSFEAPNTDDVLHISGRAANVNNQECAYELSPLTRWRLGGAPGGALDGDVPPEPFFGISCAGQGSFEISGVSFTDLNNTRTITSGTAVIYHWDELAGAPAINLQTAAGETETVLQLSAAPAAQPGDYLQIDRELFQVTAVQGSPPQYTVTRALLGSTAAAHAAQAPIYHLSEKVFILTFFRDFFGSPASGSYSYPVILPYVRIAAATLFVTNVRGNSPTGTAIFTQNADSGVRTLDGGEVSLQVQGYLAIQTGAVPLVVMDTRRAIRDVRAVVAEAPVLYPVELRVTNNGQPWCSLTIAAGSTEAPYIDGLALPALNTDAQIGLDIVSVGQTTDSSPGRDLTVTIRF